MLAEENGRQAVDDSLQLGVLYVCCNCLVLGCLISQLHVQRVQEPTCFDRCTCCHAEIEVADHTCSLTSHNINILTTAQPVLTLTI